MRAMQSPAAGVPTSNPTLLKWIEESAKLTKPDQVVWCDGSEDEKRQLTEQAVSQNILKPLNQKKLPGCYLHRSNPNDVARVEHLTFICTQTQGRGRPHQQLDGARGGVREAGRACSTAA